MNFKCEWASGSRVELVLLRDEHGGGLCAAAGCDLRSGGDAGGRMSSDERYSGQVAVLKRTMLASEYAVDARDVGA